MTKKPGAAPVEGGLSAASLSIDFDRNRALSEVTIGFEPSTATAVIGPNGCGKSTLLRALARLLKPTSGTVYLDGELISKRPTAAVARRLAILPQGPPVPEGVTVAELVEQGRYAHVGPLRMLRHQDGEAVRQALELTGMTELAGRAVDTLSGGERQRAWLALTLAQDASILLLDEPTTFLDIRHQLEMLELVADLRRERGITIVMALHDINHAARYSDRIVAMSRGRIVADDVPANVVTGPVLLSVFGVLATVISDPRTGSPVCIPFLPVGEQAQRASED